jgi:hypothetical protein
VFRIELDTPDFKDFDGFAAARGLVGAGGGEGAFTQA